MLLVRLTISSEMNKRLFHAIWPLLLLLVITGGAGCSSIGVKVQRDTEIKDQAVQVDVIPISEDQKDAWSSTNVTAYWSQVITGNADPKATILQFNPGTGRSQSMKMSPKGVDYFVVISDFPSMAAGQNMGSNDPRLCVIPVNKLPSGFFGKRATVKIEKNGLQPPQLLP
jgi:hypothetical protein